MKRIRIFPDYSYKQDCHFCKSSHAAVPGKEQRHDFYYIAKVDYGVISSEYTYHMVEVGVPSCDKSGKLDLWKSVLQLLVMIILLFGGIFFFGFKLGIDIYLSMFIALIIALLGLWCFSVLFNRMFSFHSDIVDYPPVAKLIEFGFVCMDHRPKKDEVEMFNMKKPLDQEAFSALLKDICEKDHCQIL